MPIDVNTLKKDWVKGETVAELLRRMNYIYPMLVIKINGEIIPRSQYATKIIPDGSTVEVIHLESGG
jgi:thiamine biosynthesis protein ThiS